MPILKSSSSNDHIGEKLAVTKHQWLCLCYPSLDLHIIYHCYYHQREQGSVPGQVIPKTPKMALDAALLNIHPYKVCIKCKMEQSKERSSTLYYTSA